VRPGDTLGLDVETGFFSGGAAPGATIRLQTMARALPFVEAYPDFAAYAFDESDESAYANNFHEDQFATASTDAEGRARVDLRVPTVTWRADDEPIDFGSVDVSASVSVAGRATASSGAVSTRYAAFAHYVGLKAPPAWRLVEADPELEAVVVTRDGAARPGVPVRVRIEALDPDYEDGDEDDADAPRTVLARCTLVAGTPAR
jgi:hypothetical protein